MVAVDGEDGQADVEVAGLVVDRLGVAVGVVYTGVGEVLHLDGLVTCKNIIISYSYYR